MPTIRALSLTPVKGTALHAPASLDLRPHGAVGNRDVFLIDEDGRMINGKRHGALATVVAQRSSDGARLTMTLPDGAVVSEELPAGGEPTVTDFFGRPVVGRVLDGPWAPALSRLLGAPVRLVAADRPGDAVDVHPVTVMSTASLAALAETGIDPRRFRMLVEVEGCGAFAEDSWRGRTIALGEARVRIGGPVPRCAVVTQDPDSGQVDLPVLRMLLERRRALAADGVDAATAHLPDHRAYLGVYGTVERPGRVSVGDLVDA